jgi:hypothetical protein
VPCVLRVKPSFISNLVHDIVSIYGPQLSRPAESGERPDSRLRAHEQSRQRPHQDHEKHRCIARLLRRPAPARLQLPRCRGLLPLLAQARRSCRPRGVAVGESSERTEQSARPRRAASAHSVGPCKLARQHALRAASSSICDVLDDAVAGSDVASAAPLRGRWCDGAAAGSCRWVLSPRNDSLGGACLTVL